MDVKKKPQKEVTVKCFYNSDGKAPSELIRDTFLLFVKAELGKKAS